MISNDKLMQNAKMIASAFVRRNPGAKVIEEDLTQCAALGILKANQTYKEEKGDYRSHVKNWCTAYMIRAYRKWTHRYYANKASVRLVHIEEGDVNIDNHHSYNQQFCEDSAPELLKIFSAMQKDIEKTKNGLKKNRKINQLEIMKQFVKYDSCTVIAKNNGTTRQNIDSSLARGVKWAQRLIAV